MRRMGLIGLAVAAAVWTLGGCGDLGALLGANRTTVRLVNTSNLFSVTGTLYYHDDQNVLTESLLRTFGEEYAFTLEPGRSQTFSVDCADLQAIYVDAARLVVIGELGPEADTGIFRDGDDFDCGDTLVFTFSGQLVPPALEISFDPQ